jgi:hypothetical protein
MPSTCYSYHIVMKLDISRQIFEKCSNTKFHENPFLGAQLFRNDGRTDKQTKSHVETNSRFSQYCESASKFFIYFFVLVLIILDLKIS